MTKLAKEWHGVPAETELRVHSVCMDVQKQPCAVVSRTDGEPLPHPCGEPQPKTIIAAEFLKPWPEPNKE